MTNFLALWLMSAVPQSDAVSEPVPVVEVRSKARAAVRIQKAFESGQHVWEVHPAHRKRVRIVRTGELQYELRVIDFE